MTDQKISVYSLSDLKATLDDHLPIYLTSPNLPASSTPLLRSLRLRQSYTRTNIRLALGYTAVTLALYIFYLDYYLKVSWRAHKTITTWAVLGYGVLNAAMMAWSVLGGEGGLIFEGSRGGKQKAAVRVYSLAPHRKYEPVYRMVVYQQIGAGQESMRELVVPFTRFFQADGIFVSGEFERWLRGEFPELLVEGGNVQALEAKGVFADADAEVIAVETPSRSTGSQVLEGSQTKNRTKRRG